MSRAERLTALLACASLAVCTDSPDISLAGGLSEEQQTQLIERSIEQIEATANYTPEDFEQRQRAHLKTMVEEMREAALENLPKRAEKIQMLEMSQTVELDPSSAELEVRVVDPKKALALFSVNGARSYRTANASKSSQMRFVLQWVIEADDGELKYRHRGVRMMEIRN